MQICWKILDKFAGKKKFFKIPYMVFVIWQNIPSGFLFLHIRKNKFLFFTHLFFTAKMKWMVIKRSI